MFYFYVQYSANACYTLPLGTRRAKPDEESAERMPCLFSFMFGIPVDENYPIQEQQCDNTNPVWFLKNRFR